MRHPYILKIILLFIIAGLTETGTAQTTKWVIELTDKNNTTFSISRPSEYLSRRAIQRRKVHNVPIDSADLPVNKNYINDILSQGSCTYLSQSKWLNQVLINCTDETTLLNIRSLPFVKKLKPVNFSKKQNDSENFKEKIELLNVDNKKSSRGAAYDYGYAYSQVHIHNGEFLHNKGFQGKGVIIAIIDAGFYQYRNTDAFDSARANNQILGERDFVDFDNSVNEDDSHGEYCLSTIAANVPGVMVGTAPKASFWLLRSEDNFSENPVEEFNWVAAAEFADSAGADMISSSLGYFTFDNSNYNHTYDDFYNNSATVSKGASFAVRKGMIVTNSAGNEGASGWKYLLFPADADSVCAVAATDVDGNIAYFSSYGYPGRVKPNIASVGYGTTVYAPYGVRTANGTSFSNPNINGLIACLWQAFPLFDNITVLKAVYASSDRARNPDNRFGYGIPDMRRAYRILKQQQNTKLYGTEWLFTTQEINNLSAKLIAQKDGKASITLMNSSGKTVYTKLLQTEMYEVYDVEFPGWNLLPAGKYYVHYKDAKVSRSIDIIKANEDKSWLTVFPVPFSSHFTITLNPPINDEGYLQLVNADGVLIQQKNIKLIANEMVSFDINVNNTIPAGSYSIKFSGKKTMQTIQVIKQ